jgi:hypothetical protein
MQARAEEFSAIMTTKAFAQKRCKAVESVEEWRVRWDGDSIST